MFDIRMSIGELERMAQKAKRFVEKRPAQIAGAVLVKQIKTLSQEQQSSFDGVSFKPLSAPYKARKVKAGHRGIPDLTFTGKYMNRIIATPTENGVFVGPIDSFQPQAQGLSELRPHLGVHPDSIRNIETNMLNAFNSEVLG